MSCQTVDSAYTLSQFSKEWSDLAENIHKVSEKIATTTNRMQFESNLDQINFDQMELSSKIKYLPEKESEVACSMMNSIEKTLTVLDNALYTPTVNPKQDFCCLFMSSLQKGMALGLMGILAKNLIGVFKAPIKDISTIEEWKAYQEKIMEGLLACRHNGEPTSVADILEHIGNGELGSAARDLIESDSVQGALETLGNEVMRIDD